MRFELTVLRICNPLHWATLPPVHINKCMKYYKHIHFDNLNFIQRKVLDKFPKSEINNSANIFYIPNNVEIFLGIDELKLNLERINWLSHVHSFAFCITNTKKVTSPHIDTGISLYSLNIPILNCKNTYVNFYKTNSEAVKKSYISHDKVIDFYSYNLSDCILQDKLEMTEPHVIKVKEVHNIVNYNNKPRITLLIRLKPDLHLDHLFL